MSERKCSTCKNVATSFGIEPCRTCWTSEDNRPSWEPKDVATRVTGMAPPEAPSGAQGTGMKFDSGKPRWSLLMAGMSKALEGVAKVLTFGAQKYAAHSWRTVPEGKERYRDALYRHLAAIEQGEDTDPESGLRHWDHVICNALFLSELNR